ncbi:MAG: AsnC family transcriptional regulator [Amnibacterium sp.]|nr:AsnC family transcriptional regulator [Amnibacterium sp.]
MSGILLKPRLDGRPSALLRFRTVRDLDDVDLKLLLALAANPRATTVALAENLQLSRNTVQARMTALTRAGAFLDYDRCIDPVAAGYPLVAFTTLHVRQQMLVPIVEALAKIPEIVQAHGLSGSADLLVRIVCTSAEDLFRVNAEMLAVPGVERAETAMGISEVIPYRITPLLESRLPG